MLIIIGPPSLHLSPRLQRCRSCGRRCFTSQHNAHGLETSYRLLRTTDAYTTHPHYSVSAVAFVECQSDNCNQTDRQSQIPGKVPAAERSTVTHSQETLPIKKPRSLSTAADWYPIVEKHTRGVVSQNACLKHTSWTW
jgi:hypothetical protein